MRQFIFIIFAICFVHLSFGQTHTLEITINGFKKEQGKVFVALYENEKDFLSTTFKNIKKVVNSHTMVLIFDEIPNGVYAVSCFHDVNDNNKMDAYFFGLPKEPYGVSNNAKGFMGPPKFEDAKFKLNSDLKISIDL